MQLAGIIAEYDPFHNGHAAQLALLRAQGARAVAVCLSAGATQRGALPTWAEPVRVRAALDAGADLAVALPAPYACQSAEGFALAGVALLTALGCDTLAFGAETPDTALLQRTARTLLGAACTEALRRNLRAGQPFAAARAAAAEALQPGAGALLQNPNDILAVEYCKAILTLHSPLVPLALPRLGAAHDGATAGQWQGKAIASAASLRRLAAAEGPGALAPYVPEGEAALYAAAPRLEAERFGLAVLARLRGRPAAQLAAVRGVGEGLEHRLAAAVHTATTLEGLYRGLYTKRYPNARLHRLVLDAALGVPGGLPPTPPYLHVLGGRKAALPLLRQAELPASASLAELERSGPAAAQIAALHAAAVDLAALCRDRPAPAGAAYTQRPIFI